MKGDKYTSEEVISTTPSAESEQINLVETKSFQKKINERDWYIFTKSFLSLGKSGCDKVLKKEDEASEEDKVSSIGIIFNLKHGIEIFLKMLIHRFQDKEDIDDNFQSHKCGFLIESLDGNNDFNSFLKKNSIIRKWVKIKKINEKYTLISELPFLNDLKAKISIKDNGNNFFKYPQFKYDKKRETLVMGVNYSEIIMDIDKNFIKDVDNDLKELLNVFNEVKKYFDKEDNEDEIN